MNWQAFINSTSDVSTAEILVPFLFNTICLAYFFWNAYQCDPGVIRTSREEKMQVLYSLSCLLSKVVK